MKYVVLFLFSFSLHAVELPPMACPAKVKSYLSEWKATQEWQEEKQGGLKNSFYASPTATIGEWVLVRRIPQGTVLSRSSQTGRIEVLLDEKKCAPSVKSFPHAKAKGFSDKDLAAFVAKNKTGAIYVWSPRMDLSLKGIKEIQAAAREKKLPLLILLDKDVSESERQSLEKKLGKETTKIADSFELNMRHVQMHFPALLVFKDQKILPGVKYGHEKAHRYKLDLDNLLSPGKRL